MRLRPFTSEERRARLAIRHHLAPVARVDDVVDAVRGVVCLHSTDPSSVYLSAWARMRDGRREDVDRALFDERSLVRMLAMRRTVFAVPVEDVPTVQAAASLGVARNERRKSEQYAGLLGVDDPGGWLRDAEAAALGALERLGEATASDLAREVPALAAKLRVNVGKRYESDLRMASRVLLVLAAEGRIVRGRPRGSWISSQYRWVRVERWLGRPITVLPVEEAQAALARCWLSRFGPATADDLRWWTGWTAGATRSAIARSAAVEVAIDGEVGYVVAGDLEPTSRPDPWVGLLPTLDPTTMGWKGRDWYLGDHRGALFDTAGNAGPTIWVDGRIVGGWAIRRDGEVATTLLEDVGREAATSIDAEADRLTRWLRGAPIPARFPMPPYRALVDGSRA